MKTKLNIKSIIIIAVICISSLLFINICFAANTGKITVETAKLREEANTDSKVLELASMGEEVQIIEELDGWYKVKYKNITGYLRNDLLQVDGKTETNNQIVNEVENNAENNTEKNETTEQTETVETNNNEITENKVEENATTETSTTISEKKDIEKGKYKISEKVKIKVIPLISSIEMDELEKETEVEVTEILDDWVKIKTSDDKQGWVRKDKIASIEEAKAEEPQSTEKLTQTTTKIMYVNSQSVNVREQADKNSNVVKQLTLNNQVTVISTENGWSQIDINGTKGYIAESLLSSTKQETSRSSTTTRGTTTQSTQTTAQNKNTTTNTNTNTNKTTNSSTTTTQTNTTASTPVTTESTTSGTGNSVVPYAKQYLGCRYVYGGTSPSGFDCSGFTQYVYRHFGVSLNRTAAAQYSNGTAVTSLQAGDLVMFGKSGINHVGIYIGGNTFIHAANSKSGVRTDSLSSGYYKTNYVGARRIF